MLWNLVEILHHLSLRYADTLIKQREETLAKGQEFLTWNDVQKCIDTVNVQVHEEHERKKVFEVSGYALHHVACGCLKVLKPNSFKL